MPIKRLKVTTTSIAGNICPLWRICTSMWRQETKEKRIIHLQKSTKVFERICTRERSIDLEAGRFLKPRLHPSFSERTWRCRSRHNFTLQAFRFCVCRRFFSFLKKHHLLASVDPHDPLDETDEAGGFLSLSFLWSNFRVCFPAGHVYSTPFVGTIWLGSTLLQSC